MNARNELLWNRKSYSLIIIVECAKGFPHDWREAWMGVNSTCSTQDPHITMWSKPPLGWLKLNVDAH